MTPRPRAIPITLDFALLRGAIEEIPFGVATTRGNNVTYANAALERTFGATPGGLDRATLATLFTPPQLVEIERALDERRVFDGRLRGKGIDGRAFDAEVHVERYVASQGIGGFVIVRDVTLELGALGRLVDLLGGAIFRWRVDVSGSERTVAAANADRRGPRSALEYVSPSIGRLTGLEADGCAAHPELLVKHVSAEERDRIAFQYRRLAHGDVATASAQINLRRADGTVKLLNLRATGRRDTTGVVRHIEGVLTEAAAPMFSDTAAEGGGPAAVEPGLGRIGSSTRAMNATSDFDDALMVIAEELLREVDQHHQTLLREVRLLRSSLLADGPSTAADATGRLARITASASGATALTRRVRRALRRSGGTATVAELLDEVRAALAPSFGEAPLTVHASAPARDVLLHDRVDELALTFLHVALGSFRVAGSGSLRVEASLDGAGDVCVELMGLGPPAHGTSDGDSGRASLYADLAELRESAHALVTSFGGTVQADLKPGPEVKVIVHLPR